MRRNRTVLFAVATLVGLLLAADASAAYRSGVRSGTYAGGRGGVSGIRLFHRSPYEVNRSRQPAVRHIPVQRSYAQPVYRQPVHYQTYRPTVVHQPRVIYYSR